MARIFYLTATGAIHGVHVGAFTGALPSGVDFIDVPETPDQIVWPINTTGRSGEEFARVVGGVLVAFDPDFGAIDQAAVDALLLESGVLRALARKLFDHENRILSLEGNPTLTAGQFKTALKALIR